MITRFKYFFILIIILPVYLHTQEKTDLQDLGIKGKVKTLWESFLIEDEKGNLTPDLFRYNRMIYFNRNGNKTEEYWYLKNQKSEYESDIVHSYWTFHYNNTGKMDTCCWFYGDSTLVRRWIYKYNANNNVTEISLYEGLLDFSVNTANKLNKTGHVLETITSYSNNFYSPNGIRYRYDNKGNIIEKQTGIISDDENGQPDFSPDWTAVYEYDNQNRLIKENADGEYDTFSEYRYDSSGRLATHKKGLFDDHGYSLTSYTYDLYGNVLKINTDVIYERFIEGNVDTSTSLRTDKNITYRYIYDLQNEQRNWYRRIENTDNKERLVTERNFEFYEE